VSDVSTCASRRSTRGIEPGTPISVVHSSGTSVSPSNRAAYAGNSALRSGVAVNTMLIKSAGSMALRCSTSFTSSVVPSRMSSRSFASTWIAPRTARTDMTPTL
jgi:hypothetical protein